MVRERGPVWAPGQLLTLITESRDTRSPRELSLGLFSVPCFTNPVVWVWWLDLCIHCRNAGGVSGGGGASLSGLGRETGWRD